MAQGLTEVTVRYWLMLGLLARISTHCGLSRQPGLPDNLVTVSQRQQGEKEGGRERKRQEGRERDREEGKERQSICCLFATEPQKSSGTFSTTFYQSMYKDTFKFKNGKQEVHIPLEVC